MSVGGGMTLKAPIGGRYVLVGSMLGERKSEDVLSTHTHHPPYTDFKDFWTNAMTILGTLSVEPPFFWGLGAISLKSFVQGIHRLAQALDKRHRSRGVEVARK